ncbi:protein JTB [Danio rerio]|uniref:Protein JTB n=1 Tax=Danio rerio TaxID=7955 RepID=Q1L897_DANRE|nr:protein JTB [Danio rerio]|eukprot:NP_001038409.1 protein JTB [Danio rerio]
MCIRVMESDCRIPMSCLRPRILALHALFWGLVSLRVFGAALLSDEKTAVAVTKAMTAPCWQLEEFVVAKECSVCEGLQLKTIPACSQTGFIEKINCTKSNRDEYKRGSKVAQWVAQSPHSKKVFGSSPGWVSWLFCEEFECSPWLSLNKNGGASVLEI